MAQKPVRVIDPTAVVTNVKLSGNTHAMAGLQAAGISDELISAVMENSAPQKLPVAWRTDSARAANEEALLHANAFLVCHYMEEDRRYSIIHLPAMLNFHLPDDLRSTSDHYLVVRAEGLGDMPVSEKPKASKGPNWRAMPKAKITIPEQVYATYDLSDDPDALRMLEKRGMSKPEIDAVIFRSHERNWPEGIDAFEKRFPKLKHFKKFKAHIAARWGDKVLVVIPAELNKKLPPGLRPYMDIYMVYTGPAVAEMKK